MQASTKNHLGLHESFICYLLFDAILVLGCLIGSFVLTYNFGYQCCTNSKL